MAYPIDPTDPQYTAVLGYIKPGTPRTSVLCEDNIYLSAEGPAYRHYKNVERTEFWDELLYATQDVNLIDETAPLNGTGAEYPLSVAEEAGP